MKSVPENSAPTWAAWEAKLVLCFSVLLFVANLISATLYPTNWMDEVMFSDPAINLAQGKGFVSTAWWEKWNPIWSGNVPLYPLALTPWVKVFGTEMPMIRAFNYFIISLVIPLFWLGIKRLNCIPLPVARLAMVTCVFLSFPLFFPYRSARPDCLGLLLCAWALWAWTEKRVRLRCICLFLAGVLMPISGLQLIGYFGLVAMFAIVLEGKAAMARLAWVGGGICTGTLALFLFYYCNELTGVINTIHVTRGLHEEAVKLRGGEATPLGAILEKAKRTATDHLADFGITPMLGALLVVALGRSVWSDKRRRLLALAAIGSSIALVGALEMTLHYLVYYHWMNFVILTVVVFALLAGVWNQMHLIRKLAVTGLLAASVMLGLPMRLLVGAALEQANEYSALQKLVEKNVQSGDIVFTDYMGYFPAKPRAREIYLPAYLKVITDAERRSINVLILDPINFEGYAREFEKTGQWTKVGDLKSEIGPVGQWVLRLLPNYMKQPTSCGYSVTILRREPRIRGNR